VVCSGRDMGNIVRTIILLLSLYHGEATAEGELNSPVPLVSQSNNIAPPAAPRSSGYVEDPYYQDYSNYQEVTYPTQQQAADRQGVEALIAAPLIVTAFSAALFGGLLSPAISYGFERMSEYEIQWPEFKRKHEKSGDSRSLDDDDRGPSFSWLDTLEKVGQLVQRIQSMRTKRSTSGKFDKYLQK